MPCSLLHERHSFEHFIFGTVALRPFASRVAGAISLTRNLGVPRS